jgi:hypothetical protein
MDRRTELIDLITAIEPGLWLKVGCDHYQAKFGEYTLSLDHSWKPDTKLYVARANRPAIELDGPRVREYFIAINDAHREGTQDLDHALMRLRGEIARQKQ